MYYMITRYKRILVSFCILNDMFISKHAFIQVLTTFRLWIQAWL